MERFLRKAEHVVKDHILKDVLGIDENDGESQEGIHHNQVDIQPVNTAHRFQSFSPQTSGNAKWCTWHLENPINLTLEILPK
jgi:hypothetical protein